VFLWFLNFFFTLFFFICLRFLFCFVVGVISFFFFYGLSGVLGRCWEWEVLSPSFVCAGAGWPAFIRFMGWGMGGAFLATPT